MGRLRIAVRRAFIISNGQPICIADVLKRAYPRLKRFPCGHRWSVRRALLQDAVVVGRNCYGRGRPNFGLRRPYRKPHEEHRGKTCINIDLSDSCLAYTKNI